MTVKDALDPQMRLAVNAALGEYTAAMLRTRQAIGLGKGMAGPADQKRCRAWVEYGWPDKVDFQMLYGIYSRQSLASGAVNKLIAKCWETAPQLIEGEDNATPTTPWDKATAAVAGPMFWRAVKEADKRRLVGRYSLLILRIADNKQWNEEAGTGRLVEMIPVWECDAKAGPLETDTSSLNFNKPQTWTYAGKEIHHSRVFIMGDISEDAIAYLEPSYNDFVNIEKLLGGVGESFLKNAARQMNINFEAEVPLAEIAQAHGVPLSGLQEVYNDATRAFNSGSDVAMITQGASVSAMTAMVPDVGKPFDTTVASISAGIDMPTRILIGNQSGERASTEDRAQWNGRCQSRRESDLSIEIYMLCQQLQKLGAIGNMIRFSVQWTDLTAPTDSDKLANSQALATVNKTQTDAGGAIVFPDREVREAAGKEPLATLPLPPSLPEADV